MKLAASLCVLGLLYTIGGVGAQPIYRQVDANGRVSFSDQPAAASADSAPAKLVPIAAPNAASSDAGNAILPFELRQVVNRYPVTLYGSDDCTPCAAGRSLLLTRGVPFTERSVKTSEDSKALQGLSGQKSLPLLAIGAKFLKGFSGAEWSQYLDAAGYSSSTRLPARYRNATVTPLVALKAPSAAATATAPVSNATASTLSKPPRTTADATTGIKF